MLMSSGAHGVELEIALAATEGDGAVVPEYLDGDHHHRLALGRVDLARHDGGARLVVRQLQFAEAAARAGREPAHVVGDLHQRDGKAAQPGGRPHHGVQGALGHELVGGGDERLAVSSAIFAATSREKPAGAFRPVPTAVPPTASS